MSKGLSLPLLSLRWGITVSLKPFVYYGGEERVRAISDPLLPLAVCMLISLSLRDKPAAWQSSNSVAEQCRIIPAWGARGRPLAHELYVPGQMAPRIHLAGPITLLGGFDMCQQFQLSSFESHQQLKLSETLGRPPRVPWAVPSTARPVLRQCQWLKGSVDVQVWNKILHSQLGFLYPVSIFVTWWKCKPLKSTLFAFFFTFLDSYVNEGWLAQIKLSRPKEVGGVMLLACHGLWQVLLLPLLDSVRDLWLLLFPHSTSWLKDAVTIFFFYHVLLSSLVQSSQYYCCFCYCCGVY